MTYRLGVDLGTTWSAAAASGANGVETIALGSRGPAMPSIVARADDGFVCGDVAERRLLADPASGVRECKRRLGDPTPFVVGGTPYGAEALQGQLLAAIVAKATEQLGEPPSEVVLTYPAAYGAYKLDLVREVGKLAGVDEVTLLTEPEAAAIHYARLGKVAVGDVVAVYDFGGGTFDAAVLRRTDDGYEVLGQPEGLERLGGVDVDQAVLAHVDSSVDGQLGALDGADPEVRTALARLREECTAAKEALSDDTDATIPVAVPGLSTQVRLTRGELEAMVQPRLHDTIAALKRTVESAGLSFDDLACVLLVGGSSRIPLVAEAVKSETGRPVALDAHPKLVVAMGASASAVTSGEREIAAAVADGKEEAVDERSDDAAESGGDGGGKDSALKRRATAQSEKKGGGAGRAAKVAAGAAVVGGVVAAGATAAGAFDGGEDPELRDAPRDRDGDHEGDGRGPDAADPPPRTTRSTTCAAWT